jgi:2-methylcitrate dehydratase PrpD
MPENRTRQLAAFAATLAYDDLPADVVTTAKQLILDTLGTAWAATTLGAGCSEVVAVMGALGGKPESTIIGSGARVCAPNAAFANGALAHALNYDAIG